MVPAEVISKTESSAEETPFRLEKASKARVTALGKTIPMAKQFTLMAKQKAYAELGKKYPTATNPTALEIKSSNPHSRRVSISRV